MSAWDQRRSNKELPHPSVPAHNMTEKEILAAPELHSRITHGDDQFHHDCAECRMHGRRMMALFNLTPQEYLDSFDTHRRPAGMHKTLYNIAKACAEEDGDGAYSADVCITGKPHVWARRRDGRECADCGRREYGAGE